MNYFPFNIGDYAAHTAHLEPMEDLAYRRLLDQYYLREGPLPADVNATAKLIRMRSCAEDVRSVLEEFFLLTDAGWTHARCDQELEKMQDKQAKAQAAGKASANARRANAEQALMESQTFVQRTLVDIPTDVQLPTPTPTPTPITPNGVQGAAAAKTIEIPDWMPQQEWTDFVDMRRAKGKRSPFTLAAAKGIIRSLDEFRRQGHSVAEVLTRSTVNGWSGVFAPDADKGRRGGEQDDWTRTAV